MPPLIQKPNALILKGVFHPVRYETIFGPVWILSALLWFRWALFDTQLLILSTIADQTFFDLGCLFFSNEHFNFNFLILESVN